MQSALRRRLPSLALLLVLVLPACGTISSGISAGIDAMRSIGEGQIERDLSDRPYKACAFDAPVPELLNAVESAFIDTGHGVSRVQPEGQTVESDPVVAEEVGDHYELEILTGLVYELDGENVVYLTYEEGPSMSPNRWEDRPNWERDGEESYLLQRTTRWDRRYYEGVMPAIAANVGEEPCE